MYVGWDKGYVQLCTGYGVGGVGSRGHNHGVWYCCCGFGVHDLGYEHEGYGEGITWPGCRLIGTGLSLTSGWLGQGGTRVSVKAFDVLFFAGRDGRCERMFERVV